MEARSGFRNGILQLAREVAFVRLLDSGTATTILAAGKHGRLRRLFGLKS
jgi:hypothetical protein